MTTESHLESKFGIWILCARGKGGFAALLASRFDSDLGCGTASDVLLSAKRGYFLRRLPTRGSTTMVRARSTAQPNSSGTLQQQLAPAASSSLPSQGPGAAAAPSYARNSQRGGLGGGGGTLAGALRSGCGRFFLIAAIVGFSWMALVGRPSSSGARSLNDGPLQLLSLSDSYDHGSPDNPSWLTQECRRAVDKLEMGA
jgi:hypothetical protein